MKLNENSKISEEKLHLLPYKNKLDLANISVGKVNKYSFVRVENNFYSVPEYLVGIKLNVKSYIDRIVIYSNNNKVCEHKKLDGSNQTSIDITHYLNTFLKKPGALKDSVALKSVPQLKTIYDEYFSTNPRKFIEILIENKEKHANELIKIFEMYTLTESLPVDSVVIGSDLNHIANRQLSQYAMITTMKGCK